VQARCRTTATPPDTSTSRARRAATSGYLLKGSGAQEVHNAIRAAAIIAARVAGLGLG